MKWCHRIVLAVAVTAAADCIPSTYAGFTTSSSTTEPSLAKTNAETARNARGRRASSSPLFRSAFAIVDGNSSGLSSAAAAAAAIVAASANQGTTNGLKIEHHNCSAIVQVVLQRIAQFKSSFAVTCNAAVAFLAAQYLGAVLLVGVASSSSVAPAVYDEILPPTGPVAAVMRVAPAGASSVANAYSAPVLVTWPRTSRDALRVCTGADVVKTLAGGSAAVAGATLGRKFFYKHIDDRKVEEDEQHTVEGDERNAAAASAPLTTRSSLPSAEPKPSIVTDVTCSSTNGVITNESDIDPAASGRSELQAHHSLASKLLDDQESAQRDFERMHHLLEARLQLEASERQKAHAQTEKELFHRRLLAARIRQDAVDKALMIQQEKEKVRANTITPELMSTIKMLSEQEEAIDDSKSHHQCSTAGVGVVPSTGSTFLPGRRKGFRSALASVSALFSFACE